MYSILVLYLEKVMVCTMCPLHLRWKNCSVDGCDGSHLLIDEHESSQSHNHSVGCRCDRISRAAPHIVPVPKSGGRAHSSVQLQVCNFRLTWGSPDGFLNSCAALLPKQERFHCMICLSLATCCLPRALLQQAFVHSAMQRKRVCFTAVGFQSAVPRNCNALSGFVSLSQRTVSWDSSEAPRPSS